MNYLYNKAWEYDPNAGWLTRKAYKWAMNKYRRWGKPQTKSKLARRVDRLERGGGQELKNHDASPIATTVGTTATVYDGITGIAQGDTSLAREGLVISPKGMQWKIRITVNSSATVPTQLRLVVFMDTMCYGALPTTTILMEGTSVIDWKEHDSTNRFRFLFDKFIVVYPQGDGPTVHFEKGYYKFKKYQKIRYIGSGQTITSQGQNGIFAYCVSTDNTNKPTVFLETRLRYHDG